MEWHITDAQSLAIIDREVGEHTLSPSEYEIVRQIIYATADFEYQDLVKFSEHALQAGAAALAARTTIVVDVSTVQAGIAKKVRSTFANPIYCGTEAFTRPQKDKSQAVWGIETLAKRYPEAIFVIGESQAALASLVNLIELEEVKPALVIGAPSGFIEVHEIKDRLNDTLVPHIRVNGRKGNAIVAATILNALTELAWQAYGQNGEA
ncbi:precorrin-8X methylmutase [Tumidithrix helvetica PCC 7403]|uniref:precorrin-8X methylmutase n=1 Tax=Tumidithrix helvetica TaxID=3457545 RepID=UPI003CB1BA6E